MRTHGRRLETLARDAKGAQSTAAKAEGDPFEPGRFGIPWEDMGVNGMALRGGPATVENHGTVKINFPLQILALPAFQRRPNPDAKARATGGQPEARQSVSDGRERTFEGSAAHVRPCRNAGATGERGDGKVSASWPVSRVL